MALAYSDSGRLDLAIPLFEQTLASRAAKLGADHLDTLASRNDLAVAYKTSGRLDLAIPLFEQTLASRTAALGADHPDTLISQNNLAAAYKNSGRTDLAIPLFERTLAARTAKLGPDHPNTLNSRNNLASAYRDAGQFDRAIPLLEQTLAARARSSAPAIPTRSPASTASPWRTRTPADRHSRSSSWSRRSRPGRSRLGPDHPDNLKTQNNLALCYRDAGQMGPGDPALREDAGSRDGPGSAPTIPTR